MLVTTQPRDLTQDTIDYLEKCILKTNPDGAMLCLSNYQIPASKANYEGIQQKKGPAFYEAGSDSGGMTAYFYYKSSNQDIYLMSFWLQDFSSCFKINKIKWEKMLNYTC